ncbi:PrgI family protein [Ruminococcaceae bacterium OttesenSCG-928-A11]|nr:PrgI family protein [Ruminococcaceae bacterium OttesenSCG-928-A11]
MGQYKVPQDVEADDKILGPFSFRQFVYLLIAGASGVLMWILGSAYLPLALIPLPFLVMGLILALPLRRDQPMETYLLAIAKYLFLPKKRFWESGSADTVVEVDATPLEETPPTKDIRGADAINRISFLSNVLDTAGWSTRGVEFKPNENINEEVADEVLRKANQYDSFEETSTVAQNIDAKLHNANTPETGIIRNNNA